MDKKDIQAKLQQRLQEHLSNKNKPSQKRSNGAANRATRRNLETAHSQISKYESASEEDIKAFAKRQANHLTDEAEPTLKIIPLGGHADIGEKNMAVIEYGNDALVIDTGFALGLDLPGVNYAIPDITYLESIKHKVRGYIYTHGHLDHIGAAPYILPKVPAPIYGSRFTLGMVERQLADSDAGVDYTPKSVVVNMDNNEKVKVGPFMVEFVRTTHSIPDPTAVIIETPVGKIVTTGDFRLDPEPLDQRQTDMKRLEKLGQEKVLLLISESTNAESLGRTPSEHTLEQSFHDILGQSSGRVIIATFSSNINRIQMIINAAAASGRRVVVDGRSMLAIVELAVRLGYIKIPKGTIISMKDIAKVKDRELAIICTGSQGEPNSALQRMANGEHNSVKLKTGDAVILSSNPIPGNEVDFINNVDSLMRQGVTVFRHSTHELDGCGPLHVSGHANIDEMKQMIEMVRPKYLMPNHAHFLNRSRHKQLAVQTGMSPENVALIDNGEVLEFSKDGRMKVNGRVPSGSVLVDQTGTIVPGVVVKDRLLMSEDGIVVVVLTVDKVSGRLISSPDIISRGFIYMRDNEELMNEFRNSLRQFTARRIKKVDISRFKQELRDDINGFLFTHTNRSPVIIPVVNVVGNKNSKATLTNSVSD